MHEMGIWHGHSMCMAMKGLQLREEDDSLGAASLELVVREMLRR